MAEKARRAQNPWKQGNDKCLHQGPYSSWWGYRELWELANFSPPKNNTPIYTHAWNFTYIRFTYPLSDLEKAMAPHSSTLAWTIPWTEEPGRLQSTGSRRVRHDRANSLSLSTFTHWRRKWQPTPVFLPGESQGGVAQSRTWLKWLSSSSIRSNCFISYFMNLLNTYWGLPF